MNGKALQMNCRDMPLARALKKSCFFKTKTKNAYDL